MLQHQLAAVDQALQPPIPDPQTALEVAFMLTRSTVGAMASYSQTRAHSFPLTIDERPNACAPGLQADVVEPRHVDGLKDGYAALVAALESPLDAAPLRQQASASDKIAIVFSDITRPTPNSVMIPAVLSTLEHVPDENITLINALGLYRPNTRNELKRMLGADVVDRFNILSPDPTDPDQLSDVGKTSSERPISINRSFVEADVRVVTGFIEPHFFAGFSGGAKSILPEIASQASILANHDAEMISDPNSIWGEHRPKSHIPRVSRGRRDRSAEHNSQRVPELQKGDNRSFLRRTQNRTRCRPRLRA